VNFVLLLGMMTRLRAVHLVRAIYKKRYED
jgi:hypothetical protein